ncbi:RNA methyltransferase [bacterium]|nr:RNA methyltransferase [bacterium]
MIVHDEVGVGPHSPPWPEDDRLDPQLLAAGDRRNVADRYRYWKLEAIVEDLDGRRHPFHVAVENWEHDLNIGTVIRNANAFLAAGVHIVGRRRWNRRGAMVTDRYQHVAHHPTVEDLVAWADGRDLPLVGIDNLPGSVPLEEAGLPERCVLVFGQEGPGLSEAVRAAATAICSITQYGSTRSINDGVVAGIAMHAGIRQHEGQRPT